MAAVAPSGPSSVDRRGPARRRIGGAIGDPGPQRPARAGDHWHVRSHPGTSGRVGEQAAGAHPGGDVGGERRSILGDEVAGALVAVDVGMRQPPDEVTQVEVGEDWVPGAPQQEHGDLGERPQAVGDGVQGLRTHVAGIQRDVGDEVLDRAPPAGLGVGRVVAGPHLPRRGRLGEEQAPPDERPGPGGDGGEHAGQARSPDHRRCARVGRLVDGGVGQHDARHLVDVAKHPAQGDRPAPVMGDRDDPTGAARPGEAEGVGERIEVIDALRERADGAGALREPHVQVVDGDHPPALRRLGHQAPPQVGPAGIPMDAQHSSDRLGGSLGQTGVRVEHVPRAHGPRRVRRAHLT